MFELDNIDCGILKIASLRFGEAPVTLVTGPSGGGKTTLLRLLCNILPCGGTIRFDGKDILKIDPIEYRRKVTMVSQAPLIVGGTVADNINFLCRMLGRKRAGDGEIKKALDTVMLPKKPEDDASMFSGGEKQRLCLARALFADPKALLLDEPASALDFDTASAVLHRVEDEMCSRGCRIIIVSHWVETVGRAAERLTVGGGTVTKELNAQ